MVDPITIYFQQAQPSMAAYANLTIAMNPSGAIYKEVHWGRCLT